MKAEPISSCALQQFLALVRSSLWQIPVDPDLFREGSVDWNIIGRLVSQQTVSGLAVAAALSLPSQLLPPKEWLHKAYAFAERNRRTHRLLDSCLAEAVDRLKFAGIDAVLLKGQDYARYYPDATMRQCGDIDLYIGEKQYRAAYDAALCFGWEACDKFDSELKHCSFALKGIRLELHRVAAMLPSPSADRRFQEWSRFELDSVYHRAEIGGVQVKVPSPIFDVIFVFLHLFRHFLSGGVGLRQVCDWAMLLHGHRDDIDHVELKKLLGNFDLLHAWQMFAPILVERLGLHAEECPFYSLRCSSKSDKILSMIIREGNFGRYGYSGSSVRPDGNIAGKLYSFRRHSRRVLSRISIAPENVVKYYLRYFSTGVRVVLSDLIKT